MDTTVVYLSSICHDPFWNSTFTLTSNWPLFTECFTFTILYWPVCILFMMVLPFRLCRLCVSANTDKRAPGRITVLLIIKCLGTVCLVGLTAVLIVLSRSSISYAELVGHVIRVITYTSAMLLMIYERRKHVIGSLLMFLFWAALVTMDSFSVIRSIYLVTYETQKIVPGIYLLLYSIVLLEFILCFFPDLERDHSYGAAQNPWPEHYSSVPSQIWYAWISSLVCAGWKGKLTDANIYDMPEHMEADRLQNEFDRTWKKVTEEDRSDSCCNFSCNIESICSRIIGRLERFCRRHRLKVPSNGSLSSYLILKESSPSLEYGSIRSASHTLSDSSSTDLQSECEGSTERIIPKSSGLDEGDHRIPKDKFIKDPSFSLLKVVFRLHGLNCMIGAFYKITADMTLVLQPVIIRQIIVAASHQESVRPLWIGVMLCLGLLLLGILRATLSSHSFYTGNKLGTAIKSQIMSAVFQKTSRLSNKARQSYSAGQLMTLMSVDADRIQELRFTPNLAGFPFVIIVSAVLLYYTIGISMLAGLLILILLFPTNSIVVSRIRQLQSKNMKLKEQRVKLLTDVLKGVKVLKLYAWENSFEEKISEIRIRETRNLWKLALLKVALNTINFCSPFAVTIATFATYILISAAGELDPVTAFVALTFFAILKSPLSQFTFIINSLTLALVSLKRVNDFLHCENSSPYVGSNPEKGHVLSLRDATFSWSEGVTPAVSAATIHIAPQTLTIVAGKVGSGKSSLLSGILGEINLISGSVDIQGSVAYVGQQAWIQNATVRDNILFGSNFDRARYESVLEACALVNDLMILPNGDLTEIGEKGCNLSGGQKQRVALARAVYSLQDIYLMDDPLSAVDSQVGKHIFEKVIGPSGLLKDKTRILVTHGVHWLSAADTILVMRDGDVVFQGTYDSLLESGDFLHSLKLAEVNGSNGKEDHASSDEDAGNQEKDATGSGDKQGSYSKRTGENGGLSGMSALDVINGNGNGNGSLIAAEGMVEGGVKLRIVLAWFRAGGLVLMGSYFLGGLISQAFSAFSGFWLKFWTTDSSLDNMKFLHDLRERDRFYLGIYGACGVGQLIFAVVAGCLFWMSSVAASRNMHRKMLRSVLRSPMQFFDATPVGRILNRFSSDIDTMDERMPQSFTDFIRGIFQAISTIFVVCINVPLFCTVIALLLLFFYAMVALYLPAGRQVKRMESVSKSFIYAQFGEFVSGISTIKAFGHTQRFLDESRARVDKSVSRSLLYLAITSCIIQLTDLISALFVFGVAIFAVTSSGVDSGDTGLAISYSVEFTVTVLFLVRQATEITANLVCIERIHEFCHLQPESQSDFKPNPGCDWPQEGQIEFKDFSIRYRDGLDLVLKNITATIQPCEKIAIVGRTGAGKSSMTLALFRIIEAASGSLIIDNVNIADVDLMTLRSKLSILPQDPVLFSSSLRTNLDPYNEYSDEEVMRAIQCSHLEEFVKEKSGGLSFDVGEEGKNMSVGERQLVCLARALLRQNKILVLDEATAAVDVHTDSLIQETIRTAFKDCTILTIAHRIHTIMDYDRVMVFADGQLKEFAPLKDLLDNRNSMFYSLAKEAGFV